jgi:uncharacterized protein YgbK (DUF1537 family)
VTERLIIVADDLTGAADAAAAYGPLAEVAVVLDPSKGLPDAEVLAVDTDSRYLDPKRAADAATAAMRAAVGSGSALYKKIDSTLRGNIAAELAAALRVLSSVKPTGPRPTALLAPAFPDAGRTVADGVLRVNGVPLAGSGDLSAQFDGSGLQPEVIRLAVVRRGVPAVVSAYQGHVTRGADVICCDAVTTADLETLWAAAAELGPGVLVVGSAGLTRVAARAHGADRPAGPRPAPSRLTGPVLTVLGSYSDLARQQRTAITASGEVDLAMVMAPFGQEEQRRVADELATTTRDVLLVPDPTAPVRPEQASQVAAALATAAAALLRERHAELAGLVLTGGETARAVLLAVGVHSFTVLGELDPGVVLSRVPTLGDLPLVTKAGAFGEPATLERSRRALHNRTTERTTVH